jgi:hypothetical protein
MLETLCLSDFSIDQEIKWSECRTNNNHGQIECLCVPFAIATVKNTGKYCSTCCLTLIMMKGRGGVIEGILQVQKSVLHCGILNSTSSGQHGNALLMHAGFTFYNQILIGRSTSRLFPLISNVFFSENECPIKALPSPISVLHDSHA